MKRWTVCAALLLFSHILLSFTSAAELDSAKADWPTWRGADRDGISDEKGLLSEWPKEGPKLLWEVKGLGKGYASISIADGKIFSMGKRDKKEMLIALKLEDGTELWATEVGEGSHCNCTPTIDGKMVYALGLRGDFICADTETGKVIWKKNYAKDFGGKMMSGWGYSESPLVDGEQLICTPGSKEAMIAALDKKTGEEIWRSPIPEEIGSHGKDGAGYSSVVISNACGVKQYVQLVGRGVISVDAATGKVLWTYNKIANKTANIPTPIVHEDYVFCSTGYGTGAALLKIEKNKDGLAAKEQYFLKSNDMQNHHGGMILLGDHIYCGHGHNQGFPLCLEMKTGKAAWKPGRGAGKGSAAITYADGNFYFRYEDGVMALIEATPEKYNLKGSFKLASVKGKSWPHPVIAGGKLYLRDQDVLMCYDISKK